MHVLVLSNLTSYTYNFRFEILERLLSEGNRVTVACHNDDEGKQKALEKLGCRMIEVDFNGKGTNPKEELALIRLYRRLVKTERPDIVFTFTIKMNLYGGMAAKHFKVPYVPMITGLGELEKKGKLRLALLALHKFVMPKAKAVIFQNQANVDFFKDNGIRTRRTVLVPGSGINLNKFTYKEYPRENDGLKFAFIGRITPAKGISEYLSMAEIEKARHPEMTFYVAGLCDDDFRQRIDELNAKGTIEYLGMLSDTRDLLEKVHCLILPTYHPEGLSNVLLEVSATGRPAICTSRPGCREVVNDGLNGLYCEAKNVDNLVEVVERFSAMSESEHRSMGLAGRCHVESNFDRSIVVNAYMELLK